jgi:hypothetical protein
MDLRFYVYGVAGVPVFYGGGGEVGEGGEAGETLGLGVS